MASTAPANVSPSAAMSKSVSRRRPCHDGDERERGEEIEDEGVPAGIAAPPLGDELAAERRVDEQQVVVASGVDRPVRGREQRERRQQDSARLRRPVRPRDDTSSITPSSIVSIAASAAEPWMLPQTTSSGNTRYTRRLGFRASDASSQMRPVKSGSAKTCARIVNVQGAASSTGKNVSRIARGPAPSRRAATAAIANAPMANDGDDDREQPVASERVRPVREELGAPLLIGPRPTRRRGP